ncbi:hypothetical protein Tco_0980434 [Tanacetum coccineum]
MMMYSATNSLYPCVYLATHQPPIQFVSSSAQQSPIHYYGAPAMSPAPVSYAPTPPHAFHTMTLQNPNWNMDTGASSHLADNTSILTSCSNSSIYPSVFVGNGHSIPVTHTGHSFLHTSSKPLHLNHILVTPHIIKNLISVRQFTRDNDVSVEFDAYGFSVKDYQTGRILLRCDSTGDLYPVTQQPSSRQNPVVLISFSSLHGTDILVILETMVLRSFRELEETIEKQRLETESLKPLHDKINELERDCNELTHENLDLVSKLKESSKNLSACVDSNKDS